MSPFSSKSVKTEKNSFPENFENVHADTSKKRNFW